MTANHSEINPLVGIHYQTNKPIQLHIVGTNIAEISPYTPDTPDHSSRRGDSFHTSIEEDLPIIAPGLVDLQINGYGGMDFNTIPIPQQHIEQICAWLAREGVTTYMPTVITNSDEAIESAMRALAAACEQDEGCRQSIGGIHLEGPFISPEDGPRGAHERIYVKPPDWPLFQRWQEAAGGRIKLVTLSPEWAGSDEFIRQCVRTGVIVSIGHTAASVEQIARAVDAGATMSTHLGNGSHLMLPRHPNYLWEQLAQDDLYAGLIADGFHLPNAFLKVALRAKGNKAMLVSDAVSIGGMPPGEYELHIGGKVVLTAEGKLHTAGNPQILAGSAQLLTWGISNLVSAGICSLSEAWEMSSVRPAQFMNFPAQQGLNVGAPADIVLYQWKQGKMTIKQTYQNGKKRYDKKEGQSAI